MNPEDRELVKQIFSECLLLPEDDRVNLVQHRAAGNQAVADEVLSLLRFHREETLLEHGTVSTRVDPNSDQPTSPDSLRIEARAELEPDLVLHHVWKENTRTLRRRLMAISIVLAALIACSMLRLFTAKYAVWGYGVRSFALLVTLGSAAALYYCENLSLRVIRWIELAVMASTGALMITISTRLMLEAASLDDTVDLVTANHWNHVGWALTILVYGTFMPNHWVRAAIILFPISLIPYGVTELAEWIDENMESMLVEDKVGFPFPIAFAAASISVFAAHLIHDARLGAIQARYLSQYRLLREIGRGGMGQVFEAEHRLLKRPCAIKLIRPDVNLGPSTLQRFQDEVRASALLTHPNTIEIYDYGLTKDDTFFFAMEILPGRNLAELVRVSGALPPARAVHFLDQVCGALREAHELGLIHRDVKPANIFASQRGGICDFAKLLDFGLVQQVSVPSSTHPSRMIEGTPGYMAPEQILSPKSVDARSDLFALGCVGYFILTGRPAFEGGTPYEILESQIGADPKPPSTYRPGIPDDVDFIILKCIQKEPSQRFQSALDLQQALRSCSVAGDWTEQDANAAFQSEES